jgi:hypothetical protein
MSTQRGFLPRCCSMVDEFESFARQQEELEQQRRNLASDVRPEWAVLKGLVSRFALDEKRKLSASMATPCSTGCSTMQR